jgi:hypothetical protein
MPGRTYAARTVAHAASRAYPTPASATASTTTPGHARRPSSPESSSHGGVAAAVC